MNAKQRHTGRGVPGRRPAGRGAAARRTDQRLEAVLARLEATERRQQLLEGTVSGLARELGASIAGSCGRCERSYLLVRSDALYCPACGYRRAL
ncbi:hypothetical protein [Natronosalvus halobius]|uniref:hypothetical protein n=1 Tax=Natronosalvus halobius TaxID=2953746 RepID=UPI00209D098D|nr:hypothetical protein [Natronosalvus halobius]USZ71035.1 hypothetical protein NGM15_13185 [Natronosalvus halobius]